MLSPIPPVIIEILAQFFEGTDAVDAVVPHRDEEGEESWRLGAGAEDGRRGVGEPAPIRL